MLKPHQIRLLLSISTCLTRFGYISVSDVAKEDGSKKSNVCIGIKALDKLGYLIVVKYRGIVLSDKGEREIDRLNAELKKIDAFLKPYSLSRKAHLNDRFNLLTGMSEEFKKEL